MINALPGGKRKPGRPVTTGVTPKRNIRVGDVWDRCAELAAADSETMTTLVTRLLTRYEAARVPPQLNTASHPDE